MTDFEFTQEELSILYKVFKLIDTENIGHLTFKTIKDFILLSKDSLVPDEDAYKVIGIISSTDKIEFEDFY